MKKYIKIISRVVLCLSLGNTILASGNISDFEKNILSIANYKGELDRSNEEALKGYLESPCSEILKELSTRLRNKKIRTDFLFEEFNKIAEAESSEKRDKLNVLSGAKLLFQMMDVKNPFNPFEYQSDSTFLEVIIETKNLAFLDYFLLIDKYIPFFLNFERFNSSILMAISCERPKDKEMVLHYLACANMLFDSVFKSFGQEGVKIFVNLKDDVKCTALHWAVDAGFTEMVNLFIDKGADINAVDKDGKTPLDNAMDMENINVKYKMGEEDKNLKKRLQNIQEILRKHGGMTGEELKAKQLDMMFSDSSIAELNRCLDEGNYNYNFD